MIVTASDVVISDVVIVSSSEMPVLSTAECSTVTASSSTPSTCSGGVQMKLKLSKSGIELDKPEAMSAEVSPFCFLTCVLPTALQQAA